MEDNVGVSDGCDGGIEWEGKVATEPLELLRVLHRRAPTAVNVGLETGPLSTWLWHTLRNAGERGSANKPKATRKFWP